MNDSPTYINLTYHFIQILALSLLGVLGLEVFVKHLRSLLNVVHLLYLDVKSWKTNPGDKPPRLDHGVDGEVPG